MKMLEDRILIQTNLSKEELGKEGAKMEAGWGWRHNVK